MYVALILGCRSVQSCNCFIVNKYLITPETLHIHFLGLSLQCLFVADHGSHNLRVEVEHKEERQAEAEREEAGRECLVAYGVRQVVEGAGQ